MRIEINKNSFAQNKKENTKLTSFCLQNNEQLTKHASLLSEIHLNVLGNQKKK